MEVKDRFTNRVDNYVKYRPQYPVEVYNYLREQNFISADAKIADVGCGTGISSKMFLENAHVVYGVEPNKNMLDAAANYFGGDKNFIAMQTSAEATGLADASVDFVVCAQTFHWVDKEKTKAEFKRILKPGGKVALLWNDRRTDTTDFLKVYEDFLQMFGTDYKEVNHKNTQEKEIFGKFFGGTFTEKNFDNFQLLDFEGLKGRVLSSSYMPDASHPDYEFMIYCLRKIFNRYQSNDKVSIDYDTKLYIGELK
ncbi:MAG: methyltransferase [Bacteroidetes bacterium]|jgi:ubiquinone/menaquinone biosynthesis C-methylase UbiE|nr:methyltransferase [Bacteroidota bacterium]